MGLFKAMALTLGFVCSSAQAYGFRTYNATFDDITATPGTPLLFPVGAYDGLFYSNSFVDNESLGLVGVAPQSPPNSIAPGFPGGTLGLSVYYPGSKVFSFDFQSFAFGCVLADENSIASAAEACTVRVNGYRTSGATGQQQLVASAYFTYLPSPNPTVVLSQMTTFNLPFTFLAVQNVTITPVVATGGTATVAILADDFVYTTFNATF